MLRLFASVSRLHIVAIGALGTLTFGWAFTGERPWALAALCAADWFVVNLLNRVVDIPEDEANGIVGTGFVARHRRRLTVLGFAVLGASLAAGHAYAPAVLPYRVAFHALGLAYNWPLLPGRRRIKQLYFFKNSASAAGFVLTVFCYPRAAAPLFAPDVTWATVAASAGFFVLFELSYEVMYDLRDAPGDRLAGVRTYPVVHGERGAMRIIDGLIAASAVSLVAGYAAGVVPWRLFVMVLAPLLNLGVYKRAVRRGITAADCIRLTWLGAALLAAYHLWIAAGLPGVGAA
jgi:4-hydroxybenzoate polyprenyltransferase